MPSNRRRVVVAAAFYVGLVALIIGCVLVLPPVFPHWVAKRIEHNSEGYVAALLLAAWIQFARPRLRRSAKQWPATLAMATLWLAVGLLLTSLDVPPQVKMLHEAFFALAMLVPYVQLRRPLPVRFVVALAICVLAMISVGHRGWLITDLAETWGMLVLASVGFDVVDRGILDPKARTFPGPRYLWYALLVAVPIATSVLEYDIGDSGVVEVITRYASRVTEAFLFVLLVELYFAVGLGRTGVRPDDARADALTINLQDPSA